MSSNSASKWAKSRNLKLCAHEGGGSANSGRTRRSNSSGSAPSRWRCVSVFGSDWAKPSRTGLGGGMGSALLQQLVGVQFLERRHDKQTVLADEFAVKPDLAATPLGPLDADHVP